MPDIKEKLVELLDEAYYKYRNGEGASGVCESFADHLISNGVTIQKWISVEERLPSLNTRVLVYRDGYFGLSEIYMFDCEGKPEWDYTGLGGDPLFWMPLPAPPKE